MIRLKNNVMVLDTETVGGFGQPLIHDIAWQVVDKDFNLLVTRRYLVQQTRSANWALSGSQFYQTKAKLYDGVIELGEVEMVDWKQIEKQMRKDLTHYGVQVVSAYNVAFDYKALSFTSSFLNSGSNLMDKLGKRSFMCLWQLACDSILNTQEFKDWATTNKKISPSNNYQTSAETAYGFITNNPNFIEEHTALKDVEIEVEILKHIVQNHTSKVQYGLAYNCWRKVQDNKGK